MQFLSAAPVALAFDPHRKIFDMARNKIWTPPPVEIIPEQLGIEGWNLGSLIDRSIAWTLAQYGEQMEQTLYGNSDQGILLTTNRKSPLQI
jgi:hypothetical protein